MRTAIADLAEKTIETLADDCNGDNYQQYGDDNADWRAEETFDIANELYLVLDGANLLSEVSAGCDAIDEIGFLDYSLHDAFHVFEIFFKAFFAHQKLLNFGLVVLNGSSLASWREKSCHTAQKHEERCWDDCT